MGTIVLNVASPGSGGVIWEETDCPMCGSNRWSLVLHRRRPLVADRPLKVAVVQCEHCGLCFTNPRPTAETIGCFYPPDYAPHRPEAIRRPSRRHTLGRSRFASRLSRFRPERLVLPRFGQARLMDFGCGNGAFLEQMHAQGWQVLGLDASATAAAWIEKELGLRCLQGTLPHPELQPESLEVITMWSSLEHVHQPLETLRAAWQLLVPGGMLIASVPNLDSLPFRWFGAAWFALDLPLHLTHFSTATLSRMVEQAGFEVTEARMGWHSRWTQASAERAAQMHLKPAWLRHFRSRRLASLLGRYCVLTRQSDNIILFAKKPARG